MAGQLEKELLEISNKVEKQEQEVRRLSPMVEKLPELLGKDMMSGGGDGDEAKLLFQLKMLKQAAEEGLKENPAHAKNLVVMLRSAFIIAVEKSFPRRGLAKDVQINPSSNPRFGDYQCNVAMIINKSVQEAGLNPRSIAERVVGNFPQDPYCLVEKLEVAGPGFINIHLGKEFIIDEIRSYLINGVRPKPQPRSRILVDLSSPNIAKEMHVGHLRSTIIGDVIARLFEYQGHDVLRINHIGDWGTQFGMLIAHLKDKYPGGIPEDMSVQDLQDNYKESKQRFDTEEDFKKRAYQAVVKLQSHDDEHILAWKKICNASRREFQKIYERLDVTLEERGESFYQDLMVKIIPELESKGFLEEDEGRKVMFPKNTNLIPLTIIKSDGGFTYDTSDMACVKQRIEDEKAQRIIYVTDAGQATHFQVIFDCAERAGILDPKKVRCEHVGFGVVLGEDKKKFKTRSGDTVRLRDLLDEGLKRARDKLIEKGRDKEMTPEELKAAEESLAYSCIKYSDLAHNRNHEYVFSYDKMLDDKGNTAVYLLYAYTRIKSIARKAEVSLDQLKERALSNEFKLEHEKELKLAKKLLKFPEVIDRIVEDLFPHQLCELMYDICTSFTEFYDSCYCIEVDKATGAKTINLDRLVLCEATATVLKQCFDLLGIKPVSKM